MIPRRAAVLAIAAALALPSGGVCSGGEEGSVLGISFRGGHRAYPLSLFSEPRVINDEIRQQEVAVFHDAALGVSTAYFRMVLGEAIEFSDAVTGGAVAEDITTITRWDMSSGKAVGGNLVGMELVPIPLSVTTWAEWFATHPDTTVFSPGAP